ncbi:MAG: ATP-binding cassette domain-containing protein [Lachnospiraceae bacterium]|nr:ATP-binding cassette domain-containing protein [Lachnospiraceae bacterium]
METLFIENLCFSYGEKCVLNDFSLNFLLEGLTAISGPSGCGKTTLLRLLAGLEKPSGGRIKGIAPEETAILFQEDRLLPWRTVREQISDVLPKERQSETDQWLVFAELEQEKDVYPDALSGGMARRLALARCCALGGKLLLLDEPFAGVDARRRARMMERLKELGTPAILATHEQDVVAACQKVVCLDGAPLRVVSGAIS